MNSTLRMLLLHSTCQANPGCLGYNMGAPLSTPRGYFSQHLLWQLHSWDAGSDPLRI